MTTLTVSNTQTPVHLIHGMEDDLVPMSYCDATQQYLKAHHIPFTKEIIRNMGHEIPMEALLSALKAIRSFFSEDKAV